MNDDPHDGSPAAPDDGFAAADRSTEQAEAPSPIETAPIKTAPVDTAPLGLGAVPANAPHMVAAPAPILPLHTSAGPTAADPPQMPTAPSGPQSAVSDPVEAGATASALSAPIPPLVAPPSPPVGATTATSPGASGPSLDVTEAPAKSGLSRVFFGVFAAMLAFGLLATGYAFARTTDDEPSPGTATPSIATVSADAASNLVPPPVDADGTEPVTAVAKTVLPSVVNILAGQGQGSGIVYSPTHIVTNEHVVSTFTEVQVQLADGSTLDGRVIGTDPDRDLAVVEIEASDNIRPAVFAESDSVEVGQLAIALGSPFGLDQTVTSGVISAIDRVVPAGDTGQNLVAMLQTDAPINPGNSGGALADRQGRIIGMNTAIRTETGTFVGVGFAIPSDTIRLIADRLIAGESIQLGFLGVSMDNAPAGQVGALVVEVVEGSPASLAGIDVGDTITGIESTQVSEPADLAAAIRLRSPGDKVEIDLSREGEALTVTATLSDN